jgi:hypothetical protein
MAVGLQSERYVTGAISAGLSWSFVGKPRGPLKTPLAGLYRPDVGGFDRICARPNSPSPGSFGVRAARDWKGDTATVRNVAGRGGVP